jgi:hypothetical protein
VLVLAARTLSRNLGLLVSLAVVLMVFQFALVGIAAALAESGGFNQLASLAPAFIAMVMGPALTSFAGLCALSFFEPLIIMVLVQVAIYLASEPAGDVDGKLVDLILARPLPRHVLVTRTLTVMTGTVELMPIAMAATLWPSLSALAPAGAAWPSVATILRLVAYLAAVCWCFGGVALAAGAWARRRGQAQSMIGLAAVAFYLMEFVGEAWPRNIWLAYLSPFHHFHGSAVLAGQTNPAFDLGVLMAIGLTGVIVAYWKFNKRDL